MSIEAAKWRWGFEQLGHTVLEAPALGMEPNDAEFELPHADVYVVENVFSLPLNPPAARRLHDLLRDRSVIVRHHDLPWERARFAGAPPPPDERAWTHVVLSERSRRSLLERTAIEATRLYNRFATEVAELDRVLDPPARPLVLQPTRAIARKGVAEGLRLAEAAQGTYWLRGPAEEGYDDELAAILAAADVPVWRGRQDVDIEQAYADADLVAFPSTEEGFGNPPLEASVRRRPVVVGPYEVGRELVERFGFRWQGQTDDADLAHNHDVVRRHFDIADLPGELASLLAKLNR